MNLFKEGKSKLEIWEKIFFISFGRQICEWGAKYSLFDSVVMMANWFWHFNFSFLVALKQIKRLLGSINSVLYEHRKRYQTKVTVFTIICLSKVPLIWLQIVCWLAVDILLPKEWLEDIGCVEIWVWTFWLIKYSSTSVWVSPPSLTFSSFHTFLLKTCILSCWIFSVNKYDVMSCSLILIDEIFLELWKTPIAKTSCQAKNSQTMAIFSHKWLDIMA